MHIDVIRLDEYSVRVIGAASSVSAEQAAAREFGCTEEHLRRCACSSWRKRDDGREQWTFCF